MIFKFFFLISGIGIFGGLLILGGVSFGSPFTGVIIGIGILLRVGAEVGVEIGDIVGVGIGVDNGDKLNGGIAGNDTFGVGIGNLDVLIVIIIGINSVDVLIVVLCILNIGVLDLCVPGNPGCPCGPCRSGGPGGPGGITNLAGIFIPPAKLSLISFNNFITPSS